MLKIATLILFTFSCITTSAQFKLDTRVLTLKSDVILLTRNIKTDSIYRLNDFIYENYYNINSVDSLIKTDGKFSAKHYLVKNSVDGQDYFSVLNKANCLLEPRVGNAHEVYTNLIFLKREGKQYRVLLAAEDIIYDKAMDYITQIKNVQELEAIKNPQQRFTKTIDWFIKNGKLPDYVFTDYYEQQGFIKDSIPYTHAQYEAALANFLEGKEDLAPILVNKYRPQLKDYYLQALRNYSEASGKDWNDYYRCNLLANQMLNLLQPAQEDDDDYYNRLEMLLIDILTKDEVAIDNYFKDKALKQLIILLEKI